MGERFACDMYQFSRDGATDLCSQFEGACRVALGSGSSKSVASEDITILPVSFACDGTGGCGVTALRPHYPS
jgi:hypothetical protein